MLAPSTQRQHGRERVTLSDQVIRSGDSSPATWTSNEELIVSDVFAPQTPEYEGPPEDDEWLGRGDNSTAPGAAHAGFHMQTPESSPARRDSGSTRTKKDNLLNGTHLNTGEKKTGRPKRRNKGPAERLAATNANGVSAVGDSVTQNASSEAPSSSLTPLAGGNKSSGVQSSGGASALKQQLENLNLAQQKLVSSTSPSQIGSHTPSSGSVHSDSDQTEILTTYEVSLEHDFISADAVGSGEDGAKVSHEEQMKRSLRRKMSAADFEPVACLGKGAYGTVLLVRHKITGALYAQKQFRKASLTMQNQFVEQTKTERTILESVNRHPFVVKLFYAFQDHEKLYLILEYAQGGELFTHLAMERMFTEDATAFYMAEMVLALEHLHTNVGVVYRDLKPENCLLDAEGHLVLTDFGLSKIAVGEDDRCNSTLGTIEYMAPEVIQSKPYGKACDWWSLGALGFDLLTGSPPFRANNHKRIAEKIVKQKLAPPYFLGPDAKDLFLRLLRKDPHKRLGYHMPKDLQTIKAHRFFRKIDWKALERRELEPPINPVVTDPALAENFSADFTTLPLSPVAPTKAGFSDSNNDRRVSSAGVACRAPADGAGSHDDLFGGFSFVASSSLLESGFCLGK